MKIKRPTMFKMAENGIKNSLGKTILNFIIVFSVASIISSIPCAFIMMNSISDSITGIEMLDNIETISKEISTSRSFILVTLFSTILSSLIVIWYCKSEEKRNIQSIGFQGKHPIRDYGIGLLIGFLMFSSVVAINVATGAMKIEGIVENFSFATLGFIAIFFLGYFFQGANEEIITRGYLMVSVGAKHKIGTAVIISAITFSIMHGLNTGITMLALINIALIGIFWGLYIICFDNIWGACAMHSIWNFVQGCFYGIQVSGTSVFESVLKTTIIPGKELINGGSFGAEGGIATTIVIGISIVVLLIYMKKTGKMEDKIINNSEKNEQIVKV